MVKKLKKPVLLVDASLGVYIPQAFAERYADSFDGIDPEALDILLEGPDHEEYWDAWDEVVNRAVHRKTGGSLFEDQDLWLVPEDFDFEAEGWT